MIKKWITFIHFFILIDILILSAAFGLVDEKYKIVSCNVGQGDSFLVQYKTRQLLVDGGPGSSVLDCLSNNMPFWDKNIDLVILTHPQQDHYGGLIDVFENYSVEILLAGESQNDAKSYQSFINLVDSSNTQIISPTENMKLKFANSEIEVVNPDIDQYKIDYKNNVLGSFSTKEDLNDFSISFYLTINQINIFFTGDIGPDVIDDLYNDNQLKDIDILKVPHHGSKNGLNEKLLQYTNPEIAIIGVGSKNRFGHPHKEVIDVLNRYKVNIYRTDELGEIVLYTDGISISK